MNDFRFKPENEKDVYSQLESFAFRLLNNYQIEVNNNYYRLIDIEFYYYNSEVFKDCYAHQDERQLANAEWYFHASGIDITFGDGKNFGGILIRGIAKVGKGSRENYFIEKQIHGPLNVKKELMANFGSVISENPFYFRLIKINYPMEASMIRAKYIVKSRRIGLNEGKDSSSQQQFFNANFRFVIFFENYNFQYKEKTLLANKMFKQFSELDKDGVNKIMGSTFLK